MAKRNKIGVKEDQSWKLAIKNEDSSSKNWNYKWNWILKEYSDLHSKLEEVSKKSKFLSDVNKIVKEEDPRTIRPIPESSNHVYGWLASRPEFNNLERYGPDFFKPMDLPDNYLLVKEYE